MKKTFEPQSPNWGRFVVEATMDITRAWTGHALVEEVVDRLTTYVTITEDTNAPLLSVMPVLYDGVIGDSKLALSPARHYYACRGHWSGGGHYQGILVGGVGCRVSFNRKGRVDYYHIVDEQGWVSTTPIFTPPTAEELEVKRLKELAYEADRQKRLAQYRAEEEARAASLAAQKAANEEIQRKIASGWKPEQA